MNSPLGKYSQVVAAIAAIGVIGAYAIALFVNNSQAASQLNPFALLAIGAIFGSSAGSVASVNGTVKEVAALHTRMDQAGIPPAASEQAS